MSLSSCFCSPCLHIVPRSSSLFKASSSKTKVLPPVLPPRPVTKHFPSQLTSYNGGDELYSNTTKTVVFNDSDYWSLDQVNASSNNYYASAVDDVVEAYDLLPPLRNFQHKPTRSVFSCYFPGRFHEWLFHARGAVDQQGKRRLISLFIIYTQ